MQSVDLYTVSLSNYSMKKVVNYVSDSSSMMGYGTPHSAGVDVKAKSVEYRLFDPETGFTEWKAMSDRTPTPIEYMMQVRYHLDLKIEPKDDNIHFLALPKSSICNKAPLLRLTNSVGLIDNDYRGEIMAVFDVIRVTPYLWDYIYHPGDAVIQLVPIEVAKVDWNRVLMVSDTVRGDGGYGSTNR